MATVQQQKDFLDKTVPAWQRYGSQNGFHIISFAIAQGCLESGWGTSNAAQTKQNILGIGPGMVFSSWDSCIEGYYSKTVLGKSSQAKNAKSLDQYYQAFVASGYLGGSGQLDYYNKVKSIINSHDLTKYDEGGSVGIIPTSGTSDTSGNGSSFSFSHQFSRDDALVKEFAYWSDKALVPTMIPTQFKYSALNYSTLLQSIFGTFGFTVGSGSPGNWAGVTGNNDKDVWNYLTQQAGFTNEGAAAVLGNMEAESGVNPKNLQNSYETSLGFTDDSYTTAVDNGTYTNFVHDSAGYGLVQFTYYTLKQQLYNKAKERNTSVGDLETQLIVLIDQLKSGNNALYNELKTTKDVRKSASSFMLKYERPADQSTSAQSGRADKAERFYNKFAK